MLPPYRDQRSMTRRDTAFVVPQVDYAKMIADYSAQARQLRMYGESVKAEREKEFLSLANVQYDPNLIEMGLKSKLVEKADEYTKKVIDIYRQSDNDPTGQDKLKMLNARNLLYDYQAQLLNTQQLYRESYKEMRNHPGFWDRDVFDEQVSKMKNGKMVSWFLEEAEINPMIHYRNLRNELAKTTYKTDKIIDGEHVSVTEKAISGMSDEMLRLYIKRDFNNTGLVKGMYSAFKKLPEKEKKMYKNVEDWALNSDVYLNILKGKQLKEEATKPYIGKDADKVVDVAFNQDTQMWSFGDINKGQGVKLVNIEYKGVNFKGAQITDVKKTAQGPMAIVQVPKLKKQLEEQGIDLDKLPDWQKTMWAMKAGVGGKDQIYLKQIEVPLETVRTYLERASVNLMEFDEIMKTKGVEDENILKGTMEQLKEAAKDSGYNDTDEYIKALEDQGYNVKIIK